jgi:hypothetical protein
LNQPRQVVPGLLSASVRLVEDFGEPSSPVVGNTLLLVVHIGETPGKPRRVLLVELGKADQGPGQGLMVKGSCVSAESRTG